MKIDFRKSFSKDIRRVKNKNLLNQVKEVIQIVEEASNLMDLQNIKHLTGGEKNMTPKQFYDWQTAGGTDDVMRLVDCLERADITWCAIDGIAVNHWAEEPMVTQDVDLVVATESVELAVKLLEEAGFKSERFAWSINFRGHSKVSIQLSTEDFYHKFPSRSVPADIHGILMRVSSLEDTLQGKIKAWQDTDRRQSKKIKDLGDIARLIESHPNLWELLVPELKDVIEKP